MGVLQEMKAILHLEEVLVDNNHLTIKDQKLLEGGQMDQLMEILEIMDPQVMEDILQDEGHQEKADLQDHQEEDHLVPLAHLEILGPQEIKDLQAPLDHEDTEDLLDHKGLWDHKVHLDKSLDSPTYLELLLHHR